MSPDDSKPTHHFDVMASLAPHQSSPDHTLVNITYRMPKTDTPPPVFVVSSAHNWVPEEMRASSDGNPRDTIYECTLLVPRGVSAIVYKFRVGDGQWAWDPNAPTENDGFCGWNNRFDIPTELPPTPPPEHIEPAMTSVPDAEIQRTALPSPAASPRDHQQYEDDSGTEIDAPSVSDWAPSESERHSNYDACSDSDFQAGSPTPSAHLGSHSMSETADWIVI
ncbi:hypothetical protein BT63DRAFT_462743 [Microthyrium microscopicum]|uniref:AMP-activated protein kinase glycogen-binding domain-containing protein n=1 Tax=Microthyrium microscopicum TaxID=703497 RepID=A0A6A6UV59_9PEZI|nr:hypothetical protein BT63DRAFT_462743 [Microthyrium microscopicum]